MVNDRFRFNEELYVRIKELDSDQSISRQDLQDFVESMVSFGGKNAIFFAVTPFSEDAVEYANSLHGQKLVLVDREKLVSLMQEFGLGIKTEQIYEIKGVDSDYFDQLDPTEC